MQKLFANKLVNLINSDPNLQNSKITLLGLPYKGIPLVTAIGTYLCQEKLLTNECKLAYLRKEVKDHGEGGILTGDIKDSKIIIIDDVLTAGTAVYNCLETLTALDVKPYALLLAFDRQEKTKDSQQIASCEIEQETNMKVLSIANVTDLLKVVTNDAERNNIISHLDKYSTV